jgi:DNA-binding transcriptional MerR regulator
MTNRDRDFYTIVEFAVKISLHPNTIRLYIKNGLISALRLGTDKRVLYRIPHSEFDRLAKCNMRDILKKMAKDGLDA